MKPINYLRFVHRAMPSGDGFIDRKILQQKWEGIGPSIDNGFLATADLAIKEEWRDVEEVWK